MLDYNHVVANDRYDNIIRHIKNRTFISKLYNNKFFVKRMKKRRNFYIYSLQKEYLQKNIYCFIVCRSI